MHPYCWILENREKEIREKKEEEKNKERRGVGRAYGDGRELRSWERKKIDREKIGVCVFCFIFIILNKSTNLSLC